MNSLEIERKYLIRMPDASLLLALPCSEIEQIYILSPEGGRERIRRRVFADRVVCTHTVKRRVSDLSRIEIEEEKPACDTEALVEKITRKVLEALGK